MGVLDNATSFKVESLAKSSLLGLLFKLHNFDRAGALGEILK